MKRVFCLALLLICTRASASCEIPPLPPGLGGPVDSRLDTNTLNRWQDYRSARVEERMLEAWDSQRVRDSYRVSQEDIDAECYSVNQLVDLGRAIFLREFTLADGLGGRLKDGIDKQTWYQRFQTKDEQSAHATSCASCHWKGGLAGAGDSVDNAFLDGDGLKQNTHIERNPIALNGAGWIQALANEMTKSLQQQRDTLLKRVRTTTKKSVKISAKGVSFGEISARVVNGKVKVDYSLLDGVNEDLVVRPFGWQGRYAKLSDMVEWSFESHLGLSKNDYVAGRAELTEGQITAVTLFIATLATPIIQIPTVGGLRPDRYVPVAKAKAAPEFTMRWAKGQFLFSELGCASCHQPSMKLDSDRFSVSEIKLSLHQTAAQPVPDKVGVLEQVPLLSQSINKPANKNGAANTARSATTLFLFSDLKLHQMGEGQFLTRPLWGLRNSTPYSFDGSANVIDQAVEKHNHPLSAAKSAAENYLKLPHSQQTELRIFLYSLMRAPEIRIR